MKRKNISYYIIGALIGTAGLTSCSDFLDIDAQDKITLDKYWNEKSDVDAMVAGCYSGMQTDAMVRRMIVWGELRSDNIGRGQNLDKDLSLENILKENLTANNAYTTWGDFYSIINRCNTIIKYAPQVAEKDPSFTQSEMLATIAEVSALRDLCYFYLIRTFRDVPFSTEAYIEDNQTMDIKATSFDEVLDFLIKDLESVKDNAVKKYPAATETQKLYQTGKITQDAIHAMLCEMYLWKQDYRNCIKYADLVIDSKKKQKEDNNNSGSSTGQTSKDIFGGYPLISDSYSSTTSMFGNAYTEIFGTGNSSESIFELTYTDENNSMSNLGIYNLYGYMYNMGFLTVSSAVAQDVGSKLFKVFRNKYDARYWENCAVVTSSSANIAKYQYTGCQIDVSGTDPYWFMTGAYAKERNKSNWIIYRLTDIMLMKAEAEAELMSGGETMSEQDTKYLNDAFAIVTAINKRSLCQSTLKDTLDPAKFVNKESIQQLVMEERRRELMFEGKRWYDLVRRSRRDGNTSYLLNQVLSKFTSNVSVIQSKLTKIDAIYWPYNIDELKVNTNLEQNKAFGSGESGNYDKTN